MPYSAYVILERALPEIDGFKPSQRRILYTMYKMGLLNGARKKSQGIVGQTMFLHPHGDASIYETLVRMSKDAEAFSIPYIDSKGNFGKQYSRDTKYASARYTEARLENISKELFENINKNTVDMIDNYDGELKEPRLLPVTFPTILVNPQSGIANGMASNIIPFNINEIIDFTIAYLKSPQKSNPKDYIKAPDLPSGGDIVFNESVIDNIINNGRGSLTIRATYEIKGNVIKFKEIPYTTTFEAIADKIGDLVKEGKIKDIVDIHDAMGITNGKGIEVTVKNNTNKELLVERLFKLTALESTYPCNFNIIIDGRPKVAGVKEIISEWVRFRANAIKRGTQFDIDGKNHKRHLLKALKEVLLDIDKAISIIREIKKNNEVVKALMDAFNIDEAQAEYVSEIKLRHLNKEYLINRTDEISDLEKEVIELTKIIEDKKVLAKLMIVQLRGVKAKYGRERTSNIIELDELPKGNAETIAVEDYNVKVFITKEGYVKKIPLTSLRGKFENKTKDDDEIIREIETTNHSDILIFTDKKNIYKYKAYELEDHKTSVLGEYIPSLLDLKDEKVLYITVTKDYTGNLVVGFDDGKVAKIQLSAYQTKQNRGMLKNAYADKNAIYFNHIHEDIDILAVSSIQKALVFNTSMVNAKSSKTTIGNQVMKSKNDSYVSSYITLDGEESESEYYRTQNAGVGKYLKEHDFKELL